jgi:hypothetical protein
VKSTPARMLHQGQLVVERYAVSKVSAEPFRIPQNTVSVELVNQMPKLPIKKVPPPTAIELRTNPQESTTRQQIYASV